jgi:hypothetical protein
MLPEDIELVKLVRDTVCVTVASNGALLPTIGRDAAGSVGYFPFLGRYLQERGPIFVRICRREWQNGKWVNRMRGCQCKGLMAQKPSTYARMAMLSARATATKSRKVRPGPAVWHKPISISELGTLSYFVYIIEGLIATVAKSATELDEEGHNVADFGLVGISSCGTYRGVICGELDNIKSTQDQVRAVCLKAQNADEIQPQDPKNVRFIRMRGRWLYDPERPKSKYF